MNDNEITEAYFRALGWEEKLWVFEDYSFIPYGSNQKPHREEKYGWSFGYEGMDEVHNDLPNILESNSAFTEHVLEVMGGEGYRLDQVRGNVCRWLDESEHSRPRACYSEFIIDNNIFRAAVIAATAYLESKEVGK